jgi:hypothetical protein
MSVSKHPVALQLEQRVGGATKLLATVMALPLVDGIFAALVVAGVLASPVGVIETGILIFGGSATIAVILAEMDGSRREMVVSVLIIGAIIIPVAAVEAAVAPTLRGLLDLAIFERFAGLVILSVAARTASAEFGRYLPGPAVIIGLGLVASLDPSGFAIETSTKYILNGTAAAAVGVGFALIVAVLSPHLRGRVDIDRFRFGSSVALGVLALPILLRPFGMMQTEVPVALAVLAVTVLFAYDPNAEHATAAQLAGSGTTAAVGDEGHLNAGGDEHGVDADDVDRDGEDDGTREDDGKDEHTSSDDEPTDAPYPGGLVDEHVDVVAGNESADADGDDPFADDDSRAPWM